MTPPFDLTSLPGAWWAVDPSQRADLEKELQREVPKGHLLDGVSARAVAVRRHQKDAVFWLPTDRQWALVHLTWVAETDPRWPSVFCTPDWDEVVAQLTNS